MLRTRLAKLEKLAATRAANCPGCVRLPPLVLVPPLPGSGGEPARARGDEVVRCPICGKVRRRPVIEVYFPGLPEPVVALDDIPPATACVGRD